MTLFDLLFIAVFLASVVTLLTSAVQFLRGHVASAWRILRVWLICAAAYMGIVVVTSLIKPRRVMNIGELQCADDWCIGVESGSRKQTGPKATYAVTLRLSSRALRVTQREQGVVVYLIDNKGRRYDPLPDPSAVPISVLLHPQESVLAKRVFETPGDTNVTGLVIAREGGFPIGWLIIGDEAWFRKPTLVRFPQ